MLDRPALAVQRSATGRSWPALESQPPTAVHAILGGQETPARLLFAASAGFGLAWVDQAPPLHRSASVTVVPRGIDVLLPTAVQIASDGHDAPFRALLVSGLATPGGRLD